MASLGLTQLASKSPPNWEAASSVNSSSFVPATEEESQKAQESFKREQFMILARERFRDAVNAENLRRQEMHTDLEFRIGKQWRPTDEWKRTQAGRPSLTINRIPGFLKHVLNTLRQARPGIKVDPLGSGVDEEIAEIRQGLIRHIEQQSQAEIAYDTAFENMCCMGLGWVRIIDGWANDGSFDNKDLYIEWVPNVFSVYSDPASVKADWSDAKYRFVTEDITFAEFKRRYGQDRAPISAANFQALGDDQPLWMVDGKVRIAEYFHEEEEDDHWCEAEDGQCAYLSEWEEGLRRAQAIQPDQPFELPRFTNVRKQARKRIVWTLMDGLEPLKERVWSGKYIPVIPFIGTQIELDGVRQLAGMVRFAREAQRMFNFAYSCAVEAIALAPKSPFILPVEQLEGHEQVWERANTDPMAFLPYNARSVDGQLLPPPQRQQAEPPIAAFVQLLQLSDNNLKATFNIYDASLGQRGPQESGIAIDARKIESDTANYDWIDNFHRGLVGVGIALDDLLEYYYNTPGRIIHIERDDLTKRKVTMNAEHEVDGEIKIYDLSKGKASISISSGPGFRTLRQEASKNALDWAKLFPAQMVAALPMLLRLQDFPEKDAVADQVEKALPAQFQQPPEGAPPPLPPQVQQQLAQMQQMIQVMSKALTEATDKGNIKFQEELWDTFRTQMQAEVQLALGQMKTGSQEAMMLNEKLFEEMERVRMAAEGLMAQGSSSQAALASAAAQPQAPAPPAQSPAAPGGPPPGSVPAT